MIATPWLLLGGEGGCLLGFFLEPDREVVCAEPGLLESRHHHLLLLLLLLLHWEQVLLLPAWLLLAALKLLEQLVEVHNLQSRLGQGGGSGQEGGGRWGGSYRGRNILVLEGQGRSDDWDWLSGQKGGGSSGY